MRDADRIVVVAYGWAWQLGKHSHIVQTIENN